MTPLCPPSLSPALKSRGIGTCQPKVRQNPSCPEYHCCVCLSSSSLSASLSHLPLLYAISSSVLSYTRPALILLGGAEAPLHRVQISFAACDTMARRPRTDSGSAPSSSMLGQVTPRRRATLRDLQSSTVDGIEPRPKEINAAPSLEKAQMYGIDNERPTSSKIMALIGRIFIETIPQWLAVGVMLGLIFGGCCSNVSARLCRIGIWRLEKLIKNTGFRVRSNYQVSGDPNTMRIYQANLWQTEPR